jgi:hypothetical protein
MREATMTLQSPRPVNPLQWSEAIGLARQTCARVFRDGGSPADAMRGFGLRARTAERADWDEAIRAIAETICSGVR